MTIKSARFTVFKRLNLNIYCKTKLWSECEDFQPRFGVALADNDAAFEGRFLSINLGWFRIDLGRSSRLATQISALDAQVANGLQENSGYDIDSKPTRETFKRWICRKMVDPLPCEPEIVISTPELAQQFRDHKIRGIPTYSVIPVAFDDTVRGDQFDLKEWASFIIRELPPAARVPSCVMCNPEATGEVSHCVPHQAMEVICSTARSR